MTKENEIKPCPICGKQPHEWPEGWEGEFQYYAIECNEKSHFTGTHQETREQAIEAWNRRTNPELSSLREERDAMSKILMEIRSDLSCRCDPAYTSRSMHEPNSFCYWIPYIEAALKQKEG